MTGTAPLHTARAAFLVANEGVELIHPWTALSGASATVTLLAEPVGSAHGSS